MSKEVGAGGKFDIFLDSVVGEFVFGTLWYAIITDIAFHGKKIRILNTQYLSTFQSFKAQLGTFLTS